MDGECMHCGHLQDEHEGKFFFPCTVEGCDCEDYEEAEETEDE